MMVHLKEMKMEQMKVKLMEIWKEQLLVVELETVKVQRREQLMVHVLDRW